MEYRPAKSGWFLFRSDLKYTEIEVDDCCVYLGLKSRLDKSNMVTNVSITSDTSTKIYNILTTINKAFSYMNEQDIKTE